ncbi:hypothetical protein ACFL44_00765 [Gemmatimonadota bacterium]
MSVSYHCPRCHKQLSRNATSCPACGVKLSGVAPASEHARAQIEKKRSEVAAHQLEIQRQEAEWEKRRIKAQREDDRKRKFEARIPELNRKIVKLLEDRKVIRLIRILNNPRNSPASQHLRVLSVAALGELGDTRASKHLVRILRDATNPEKGTDHLYFLREVIGSLGKIGDERATQGLVEALTKHAADDELSSWILEALLETGNPCPTDSILLELYVWHYSLVNGEAVKEEYSDRKEWRGRISMFTHPYFLAFDLLETIEPPKDGQSWQEWWGKHSGGVIIESQVPDKT